MVRQARNSRLVKKYAAVPVGSKAPLREPQWVRPDHEPDQPGGQLVSATRALFFTLVQKRADELQELEPREDADAIYTRAEAIVMEWMDRTRPSKARLEREVFGPSRNTKRGPKPHGPHHDDLRAAFDKLPDRVRRSNLAAAKRLQPLFPDVSIETLRKRLAKVGKDSAAIR